MSQDFWLNLYKIILFPFISQRLILVHWLCIYFYLLCPNASVFYFLFSLIKFIFIINCEFSNSYHHLLVIFIFKQFLYCSNCLLFRGAILKTIYNMKYNLDNSTVEHRLHWICNNPVNLSILLFLLGLVSLLSLYNNLGYSRASLRHSPLLSCGYPGYGL